MDFSKAGKAADTESKRRQEENRRGHSEDGERGVPGHVGIVTACLWGRETQIEGTRLRWLRETLSADAVEWAGGVVGAAMCGDVYTVDK